MAYAESTAVPVAQTRAEIERLLEKAGASAFAFASEDGQPGHPPRASIMFRMTERQYRFKLPLPAKSDRSITHSANGARTARQVETRHAQVMRSRWRALLLIIKAKLEAVETGIVTFEDEFLSQTVLHDGSTVGEQMSPQIAEHYRIGGQPRLALTGPA